MLQTLCGRAGQASGCKANNCYLQIIRHYWKPVFHPSSLPAFSLMPPPSLSDCRAHVWAASCWVSLRLQPFSAVRRACATCVYCAAGWETVWDWAACACHPPTLPTGVGFMWLPACLSGQRSNEERGGGGRGVCKVSSTTTVWARRGCAAQISSLRLLGRAGMPLLLLLLLSAGWMDESTLLLAMVSSLATAPWLQSNK